MRVLALSHSAVVPAYRAKFQALARRRGWDLHLALPEAWPEGGKDVLAPSSGREGRLQIHRLGVRLRGHVGFAHLKGLDRLALGLKPDLVYAEEEPFSLGALQALHAADLARAPFVFYTWENMDRRYKPPLNWVRRRVLAGSRGAVVGHGEGATLLQGWGWRGALLQQPQYGIPTRSFKPLPRPRRAFTVGYFGRLVPEKGVDLLIKACAQAGLRLRIGGQGPEALSLKALAFSLGVAVDFNGFVPFEQRRDFYGRIDALALPSRGVRDWKEQFGRVLAEAMACGLPCVGSDSGAIPEVIGAGGLVVPEGDVSALAAALKRLSASSALRQRLGAAGRRRALKHFDEGKLVDALGRFLEGLHRAR